LLRQLDPQEVAVELRQHSEFIEEAECDELWSFVASKAHQRWLWYAIDHATGKILAYVLGSRKDEAFIKLKALLEPFGITRFYTDDWGAYERHLDSESHVVGKENTQKIERKNLTLRTRIKRVVRKTLCFSKKILMHDIIIGLFINRYEFACANTTRSNRIKTLPRNRIIPNLCPSRPLPTHHPAKMRRASPLAPHGGN
jgi:insertion element IS1 protein InsB